jgi:LCP family protein required for cell wall assembly
VLDDQQDSRLEPKRKRKIRWRRVALWTSVALVVVILATAGGSYLWLHAQVSSANGRLPSGVAEALKGSGSSSTTTTSTGTSSSTQASTSSGSSSSSTTTVSIPKSPTGMNILVVGSDTRSTNGAGGRSDTLMIVHIDPTSNFLSILSIPRDLQVEVPGHDLQKINAAYSFGGPALTIKTVSELTGIKLDHYMEVDFAAFEDITNTLGGVYVDVDRTYNDGQIQFAPGYQLLNGLKSLEYVRTRHDLNGDFGRMERQQHFLDAVREQAMGWDLPLKLPSLIKGLFKNLSTDLHTTDFLKLAYWAVKLDGSRMKQVHIVGDTETIDNVSYVVASSATIANAVVDFLTPPPAKAQPAKAATTAPSATLTRVGVDLKGVTVNVLNGTGHVGQGASASSWLESLEASVKSVTDTDAPSVKNTSVAYPPGRAVAGRSVAQALGIAKVQASAAVSRVTVTLGQSYSIAPSVLIPSDGPGAVLNGESLEDLAEDSTFSVEGPAFLPPGCSYVQGRPYRITVGKASQPALKLVYRYQSQDQFLGIMETTWLSAPAASPGLKVEANGVTYTVVGASDKVDHIWWKNGGVLYWVSNTLSYAFGREALLATAESMTVLPKS